MSRLRRGCRRPPSKVGWLQVLLDPVRPVAGDADRCSRSYGTWFQKPSSHRRKADQLRCSERVGSHRDRCQHSGDGISPEFIPFVFIGFDRRRARTRKQADGLGGPSSGPGRAHGERCMLKRGLGIGLFCSQAPDDDQPRARRHRRARGTTAPLTDSDGVGSVDGSARARVDDEAALASWSAHSDRLDAEVKPPRHGALTFSRRLDWLPDVLLGHRNEGARRIRVDAQGAKAATRAGRTSTRRRADRVRQSRRPDESACRRFSNARTQTGRARGTADRAGERNWKACKEHRATFTTMTMRSEMTARGRRLEIGNEVNGSDHDRTGTDYDTPGGAKRLLRHQGFHVFDARRGRRLRWWRS